MYVRCYEARDYKNISEGKNRLRKPISMSNFVNNAFMDKRTNQYQNAREVLEFSSPSPDQLLLTVNCKLLAN